MKRAIPFLLAASLIFSLAGCLESGPKKALNEMADALAKKDSGAFLGKMDMPRYAAARLDVLTKGDRALSTLDNLGKMLGLGGLPDLVGSVYDVQKELVDDFTRGVSTGELELECRKSERPDCPFTSEGLRAAEVKELGPDAATARVIAPTNIASWLSLAKINNVWLVVGQAPSEALAAAYAREAPKAQAPAQGGKAPQAPGPATPAPQKPQEI